MNKTQAALFHARQLIDSGDELFICCALDVVRARHPNLADATRDLRAHIRSQLVSSSGMQCGSLVGWLRLEVGIDVIQQGTSRLARLAWIDKLMETK